MRRTLSLAIIAGLAAALAGAGTARADTVITSCPYTISTPGAYALAADLTCSENGINIAVSNVTLSLNGHIITGPNNGGGTGVNICARTPPIGACGTPRISNVQVQGPGLLQEFANGIYLQSVDKSLIQNVVSAFNSLGIASTNSTNLQFNPT
jgi:hypothetical protein